jgi:hypothetical protein
MLELNFFCPSHLTDYNTKLKFLEAFWDSETPRLGEEVTPLVPLPSLCACACVSALTGITHNVVT